MLSSVKRASGGRDVVDRGFTWSQRHELATDTNEIRRQARDGYTYDTAGRLTDAGYVIPAGKPIAGAA